MGGLLREAALTPALLLSLTGTTSAAQRFSDILIRTEVANRQHRAPVNG
jgi:hypothetical protein